MNTNLNPKVLSDDELWNSAIQESVTERNSTLKIIEFMREIYLRRLHIRRGYSSLHEYCVNVLKYSDGSASRRIKAMFLLKNIPEVKESIERGTLNLTTASQIQSVIEAKEKGKSPLSQNEKLELFTKLDGQSKREVEKTISSICPEATKRTDTKRQIAPDKIKRSLIISDELNDKIERLKSLKAHAKKDFIQILEELVDKELRRIDPLAKGNRNEVRVAPPEKRSQGPSRYVPARIKKEVWQLYNGECAYVDLKTNKKCATKYFLQVDHILPFAKGGPTVKENLQLLCANHNQLKARTQFWGLDKEEDRIIRSELSLFNTK